MLSFLFICLPLIELSLSQPVYVILPAEDDRTLVSQGETLYQNPLGSESMDALPFIEDPAKLYAPNDFLGDLHKLAIGIQQFVQNPPTSLYSALSQLQTSAKKNHKKQTQSQSQSQKPVKHKLVLDPFGNISLFLGWSVNFQLTNSIGISRSRSRSLADHNGWPKG